MTEEPKSQAEPQPQYWTTYDNPHVTPVEDGWYPVVRIWDVEEGGFPDAGRWSAGAWAKRAHPAVCLFGPRCETEAEALKAAVENDPDI